MTDNNLALEPFVNMGMERTRHFRSEKLPVKCMRSPGLASLTKGGFSLSLVLISDLQENKIPSYPKERSH